MSDGPFQACNKLFADNYVSGNTIAYLRGHLVYLIPATCAHFSDVNILGTDFFPLYDVDFTSRYRATDRTCKIIWLKVNEYGIWVNKGWDFQSLQGGFLVGI